MELPDTEQSIDIGTLTITFGAQIKKKGKLMTTSITGWGEFTQITEWVSKSSNAISLGCNGPKTWLSVKRLRLDSQPIASTSEYWNCAIQENTSGGARDNSQSFTSVLMHNGCFGGAHLTHLPQAIARAHYESNRAGRIAHIDIAKKTEKAPKTESKKKEEATSTMTCPLCNSNNGLVIPPHAHESMWVECKSCNEYVPIPQEFFH